MEGGPAIHVPAAAAGATCRLLGPVPGPHRLQGRGQREGAPGDEGPQAERAAPSTAGDAGNRGLLKQGNARECATHVR